MIKLKHINLMGRRLMTRAVIYCRVSTEEERQINALADQIESLKLFVSKQDWILVDQYIDEGISGTMTKHRNEYKRLFKDLDADTFDVIVIKSQDRLMRSTKDWYLFVDKLVQNKKRLFFYLDNKFYTPDDALITGIKAILAEEFSRDLSKKINNAHRYRQKNKNSVILTSNTWGYNKIDKQVVINEEEAKIVRMMYQMCADGSGTTIISKTLTNQGYLSRSGKSFNPSTIRRIIRNPLFKGTAVMNKKHFDFNTKQNHHNNEEDWIYKENIIPAIVTEDLWNRANHEMDKRTAICHSAENMKKKRGIKIGESPLSGKIICGECGSIFWRTRYKRANGEYVINWCCCEYVRNGRKTPTSYHRIEPTVKIKDGGCDNIHIHNSDIEDILSKIANMVYQNKETVFNQAMVILKEVMQDSNEQNELLNLEAQLADMTNKRSKLLDRYLDEVINETVYKSKDNDLAEQISKLEKKIAQEKLKKIDTQSINNRFEALQQEVSKIVNKEVALNFLYKHIKSIKIYPEQMLVDYDIFPQTIINITKVSYHKTLFSVCGHK